jgi:transcriptional regulator with XRE-family HTH domain
MFDTWHDTLWYFGIKQLILVLEVKMTSLKQKFGKRVREIRKSKGITQEQIAELISIEPPNVSKMESGLHFPQPDKIEKIANALNVSVQELFDFEHIQKREDLIEYIISSLPRYDNKTLELVYKFVYNLNIYK